MRTDRSLPPKPRHLPRLAVDLAAGFGRAPYARAVPIEEAFPEASDRDEALSAIEAEGRFVAGGGASPLTIVTLAGLPQAADEPVAPIPTEGRDRHKDPVEAMAQDVADILAAEGGVEQHHLTGRGWLLAEIVEHLPAALEHVTARAERQLAPKLRSAH